MRRVARPPNGSRVIFSCTELAGLKEDEMGSQGPQCHGGCQKIPFSIVFGLLLPN